MQNKSRKCKIIDIFKNNILLSEVMFTRVEF
jgi:hypothetical protein